METIKTGSNPQRGYVRGVTANYLTILDFEEGQVFQYNIKGFNDNESCEDFITRKGHDITSCKWMVHRDEGVIYPIKNNNFRSGVSTSM